jgi:hypothetical protein
MIRLIHKISAIVLAGLLGLNLAAGGAIAADPCLPSLCPSGLMDMRHHNGMFNFALPMQGCGENCTDIFCNLMKDPLQDANAVNSSPYQGHHYPVILATVDACGQSGTRAPVARSRHRLVVAWSSGPIPLYLEHLSLII